MAEVYDRWHLSRPLEGAELCREHSSRTRRLVPSADHGTGKRWQVRYRDANGEQRKENFERKADADARAAKVKADLDSGQYVDRAAGRQTLRTLGEAWRTSAIHRERTEGRVERTLRLHLYPTFGNRAVASIKRSDVQAWVKGQASRYEASTVGSHFEVLNTVLRMAVLDGVIRVNPCEGVTLPEIRSKLIIPHPDSVKALIDVAPARYRALVRLAASSGLRQGELFGLEDGVDIERAAVEVSQQLVTPDKGPQYIGLLKTPESYREVPLAPSAVAGIVEHRRDFPTAGIQLEDRADPLKPVARTVRLLFTDDKGRPIRRSTWTRIWQRMRMDANRALQAAGSLVRVPEKLTLHGLRDFYASALIKARENVKTVQVRLGHSKPSITLDKYTGLWPTAEDTTASAIESILGVAAAPVEDATAEAIRRILRGLPPVPLLQPSALVVPSQPGTGSRVAA
ncbi:MULTISPECIES: tyrosine-type recombinase/integrase [Streptomyces]|uniref:Site-specific integrase n=1 Tax=Streptomyces dengpaensis TaxID=2049881 RepID=A0ABN5I968_9ACTN|nr:MULTISPECIES: site-specific integrase [Streptomyces]AVH59732.1 site-specific integrase [Streptomyces dengpaensis]PIB09376.1 site-specific integrase [Streptomyces sp. HG99]